MAPRINTAPPRGTRDVLPDEVELREAATQRILTIYRGYGFRRIETPALESLALLAGSEGGENEKLIFNPGYLSAAAIMSLSSKVGPSSKAANSKNASSSSTERSPSNSISESIPDET